MYRDRFNFLSYRQLLLVTKLFLLASGGAIKNLFQKNFKQQLFSTLTIIRHFSISDGEMAAESSAFPSQE